MKHRAVLLSTLLFGCLFGSCLQAYAHNPQQILEGIRGSKNEGEKIVANFCASCHAAKPLISLGAPVIHKVSDWQLRVKAGLDRLLKHTEDGYGVMPPRGGCFECTDLQLKLAIAAMLPESLHTDYK